MPGAKDSVVLEFEENELVCKNFGHRKTSPGLSNEPFPDGVERLADVQAESVEGAFLCKGGL